MTQRRLWLVCTIAFAISLVGAAILFTPTLEFAAVDLIEKFHLPIGPVGNLALDAELILLISSIIGLVALTVRHLLRRRTSNP